MSSRFTIPHFYQEKDLVHFCSSICLQRVEQDVGPDKLNHCLLGEWMSSEWCVIRMYRELGHTWMELGHYIIQHMTEHLCESHREEDPWEFRNGHICQAELSRLQGRHETLEGSWNIDRTHGSLWWLVLLLLLFRKGQTRFAYQTETPQCHRLETKATVVLAKMCWVSIFLSWIGRTQAQSRFSLPGDMPFESLRGAHGQQ